MNTIREAFLRMQAGQIDADTFLAIIEQEMMKACVVTEGIVAEALSVPRLVLERNSGMAEQLTTALQKRARGEE